MTGPEDHETRPISVAELLARNDTIGAKPIGGRRRRRRGNADAVTVAELTGEIPVVDTGETPVVDTGETPVVRAGETPARRSANTRAARTAEIPAATDEHPRTRHSAPDVVATNGTAEPVEAEPLHDYEPAEHEHDYEAELHEYDHYLDSIRGSRPAGVPDQMAPDPIDEDVHAGHALDHPEEEDRSADGEDLPSYLRSEHAPLFGGHTVADDLARRRPADGSDGAADDEAGVAARPETTMTKVVRGAWIVAQSIIAVAFGAGLFLAFLQLWKWNNIVALALSVLVILALVVAVRLLRKTEDITSTLIAVAVGALVTFGPLALMQPN